MLRRLFLLPQGQPDWRGPEFLDPLSEFGTDFSPPGTLSRRQIVKLQSLGINADRSQQAFQLLYSFCSVGISFQEMALALHSASDKNTISAPLKSPQDIDMIKFAGAGQAHDLNVGSI